MMKSIKSATWLVTLAVLGMSTSVAAQGFYVGASALQSRFDSGDFDVEDVDDEDTGWKLIAGFRATPNWGLEGTYTRFGKAQAPSVAVGGPFEAKAQAISLFGVGVMPVGPVELFLKVGASRMDAKGNVGAVLFDEDKIELAYGAGLQFNLGGLGLRAEYEKFDTDIIGDLDVISAGVVFTFAPRM